MQTRRSILSLLAAAPAVVATTGLSGCAPGVDAASAWRSPGAGEADPRRFALAHAILAPNPHNRQPWQARLAGAREIELFFDTAKLLPATDPFSRQITVGGGTFLELLSLAAAEVGYTARITGFPEGESPLNVDRRPFAHVTLVPGAAKDPLFARIGARRTNREPFDTKRPVPASAITALTRAATFGRASGGVIADNRVERLRDLTDRAYKIEVTTPYTLQESIDLMRIGSQEIAQHRDGLFLDGPFIEVMAATGILTRETLATPGSIANQQGVTQLEPATSTAMAYVTVTTPDNGRLGQLDAGRAYARANLEATRLGLAMHPLSQALQEYPEMDKARAEMDAITGAPAEGRLQMLARVGYAKAAAPPAPRRDWQAMLRA